MVNPIALGIIDRTPRPVGSGTVSRPVISTKQESGVATRSLPDLLNLASQLAALGPPADLDRIAEVRKAIAQGQYKIDPDAISKAILNFDAPENP